MIELKKSVENYGDTKNNVSIVSTNKNKFFKSLNNKDIEKIEKIAFYSLNRYGYKFFYANHSINLSRTKMIYLKIIDFINRLRLDLNENGFKELFRSIKYHIYHQIKLHL